MFRLIAVLIPLALLGLGEAALTLGGYGYPTDFFIPFEERDAYVSNLRYGWRFFPRALAREPVPTRLPARKGDRVYRIFVLGGSAAQGVPDPAFGFDRILGVMLTDAFPQVQFEVVNAAMTAINSHVVLPIARDCTALDPDLFVVYMGNNEIVGPYGVGSTFQTFTPYLSMIRASIALRATHIGQMTAAALGKWRPRDDRRWGDWRGLEMFTRNRIAADDPRMTSIYGHFKRNLTDISRVGTDAGAGVLLCTVGVNLRDCPPFASEHRPDLGEAERAAWENAFQRGVEKETEGNVAEAITSYREAARIDDAYAELHFRLGRCHAAAASYDEAKWAFVTARDRDVLRFRADSRINAIIREVARQEAERGVGLVDAEKILGQAADLPDLPGEDLFYEHVHMTLDGYYELARAVFEQIVPRLPPSLRSPAGSSPKPLSAEACAERLALSIWDERAMLEEILNMVRRPPFTAQLDQEKRMERFQNRLAELARLETPEQRRNAVDRHERAIARGGDDSVLRDKYGRLLLMHLDDYAGAERQFRASLDRVPHVSDRLMSLGVALQAQDRAEEAKEVFERAVEVATNPADMCGRIARNHDANDRTGEALYWAERALDLQPDRADALSIAGNIYLSQSRYEKAVPLLSGFLRVATDLSPRDGADVHDRLAAALSRLGRHEEAMGHLRDAIRIDPTFATPRLLLAQALAGFGRSEESAEAYRDAIRLEPDNLEAHRGYFRLLAAQERYTAAAEQGRAALAVAPDDLELLDTMAWLLATCPEEAVRDSLRAVEYASRAARLTNHQNPETLNTLAVARAECGEFDEAVRLLDRALELAAASGNRELGSQIRRVRRMFQSSQRVTDTMPPK